MTSATGPIEEFSLCERLTQADLNNFIEQGIPPIYLARTWLGVWAFLQRDRVVMQGDGFEFARYLPRATPDEISAAFIFVLFDCEGQPVDLAAWRPNADLALWRGRVWALGEEQVGAPRPGEPLRVHGNVLDWLRTGREGIMILNAPIAAWALRNAGTLAVETREAADKLRDLLTIPPPPVVVRPFLSLDLDEHAELHGSVA